MDKSKDFMSCRWRTRRGWPRSLSVKCNRSPVVQLVITWPCRMIWPFSSPSSQVRVSARDLFPCERYVRFSCAILGALLLVRIWRRSGDLELTVRCLSDILTAHIYGITAGIYGIYSIYTSYHYVRTLRVCTRQYLTQSYLSAGLPSLGLFPL